MSSDAEPTNEPPLNDFRVSRLLAQSESYTFDCKRIGGKIDKLLETVVAFANSDGGTLALGLEDPDKGKGRDRVLGIQERLENWDELQRKLSSRITDPNELPVTTESIGCTLADGTRGSVILLRIGKSKRVHSVVDGGTFIRLTKGNKQITANEITDLCHARGVVSAESWLESVDFELLETDYWKAYARQRRLTRSIDQAMFHAGLARKDADGALKPTRAAVLLFAEEPSGLLASKAAVRIFHYRGPRADTDPNTNLVKLPFTVGGPLIRQIRDTRQAVIEELGKGVQHGPLGFEIVQKYPIRVIAEAITNAVIHRDYRLPSDVVVRIFSDHIEVESPGLLVGPVTASNIQRMGAHSRNALIIQHLREFPDPPNLDAGEGVPMMIGTMREAGLYPPLYITRPRLEREAVIVYLWNQNRPSIWEQVSDHIDQHGSIGNPEVRQLMGTDDKMTASKQLKAWLDQGLIVIDDPYAGKRYRRYTKPNTEPNLGSISNGPSN